MADLVIRGGTIYDGSGGDRIEADVAIKGGRISLIFQHWLNQIIPECCKQFGRTDHDGFA